MTLTKTKAQQYLIDCIDLDGYDYDLPEDATDKEKVQAVYDVFMSEKAWHVEQVGLHEAVKSWLQGLPTSMGIVYMNHDILELAREWGTLELNAIEAKEMRYINGYFQMLATNLLQLFKKHGCMN